MKVNGEVGVDVLFAGTYNELDRPVMSTPSDRTAESRRNDRVVVFVARSSSARENDAYTTRSAWNARCRAGRIGTRVHGEAVFRDGRGKNGGIKKKRFRRNIRSAAVAGVKSRKRRSCEIITRYLAGRPSGACANRAEIDSTDPSTDFSGGTERRNLNVEPGTS